MPHQLTITGQRGVIKWGYVVAAEVAEWAIAADATGGELTGRVSSPHNTYAVSQQPVRFVVPRAKVTWEWPIDTLQIADDGRLTARVGPIKE